MKTIIIIITRMKMKNEELSDNATKTIIVHN